MFWHILRLQIVNYCLQFDAMGSRRLTIPGLNFMTLDTNQTLDNVTKLQQTPREIEPLNQMLIQHIEGHIATKGNSWRKLEQEVLTFVRNRYKSAYSLVADGTITADEIEKEIKSHAPSFTYINNFVKGQAICIRYTNTLANFFEQKYSFSNFNPCDAFLKKVEIQTNGIEKCTETKM